MWNVVWNDLRRQVFHTANELSLPVFMNKTIDIQIILFQKFYFLFIVFRRFVSTAITGDIELV